VIGSYHNISASARAADLGYWILNDVVCGEKSNPMPNFAAAFHHAHETMIWRPHRAALHFNYEAAQAGNEDIQSAPTGPCRCCTGEERLKGRDGKKLHPTQKPRRCSPASSWRAHGPTTSCSTRSTDRHTARSATRLRHARASARTERRERRAPAAVKAARSASRPWPWNSPSLACRI